MTFRAEIVFDAPCEKSYHCLHEHDSQTLATPVPAAPARDAMLVVSVS
jgi:hypothetical protein